MTRCGARPVVTLSLPPLARCLSLPLLPLFPSLSPLAPSLPLLPPPTLSLLAPAPLGHPPRSTGAIGGFDSCASQTTITLALLKRQLLSGASNHDAHTHPSLVAYWCEDDHVG